MTNIAFKGEIFDAKNA